MNITGGRLVLFLVTAGTAAGIWVIHDSQKTEREVTEEQYGSALNT